MMISIHCSTIQSNNNIKQEIKKEIEIKIPKWVPQSKRLVFKRIIQRAKEYSIILKSNPKIVDCLNKEDHIILRVKRSKIITDVLIYGLNLKSYKIEENKFKVIQRIPKLTFREKIKYGSIGFGTGVTFSVVVAIIILLL